MASLSVSLNTSQTYYVKPTWKDANLVLHQLWLTRNWTNKWWSSSHCHWIHISLGTLQYLTWSRSEISFTINQLCQFLQQPRTPHLTTVKWILRYLKGTITRGLFYKQGSLQIQACSDVDWAARLLIVGLQRDFAFILVEIWYRGVPKSNQSLLTALPTQSIAL